MKLSIVIPTLNEAGNLRKVVQHTLDACAAPENVELIVVDNGSTDGTLSTIADLEVGTFEQPQLKGRKYAVLNYGYQQATGEVIIFLDADTLLPENFDLHIANCLENSEVVGGAFDFQFQERRLYLQLLAFVNRIRIRIDHNFLGDQALFCRKLVLNKIGGYPEKLIMESAYLCHELKIHGRLKIVPACIHTSARRFLENGFLKVLWYDFKVWVCYVLGQDTDKFGSAYWQHNDSIKE